MGFSDWLFNTTNWPPRWRCGTWSESLGWTHIISEFLIWGAYMAIPLILIYFIRKRKDFPFHRVFFLFAAFIIACGLTHFLEGMIFYYPMYRFLGLLLVITAVVSWGTVFALIPALPKVLALPSLENVNQVLQKDLGNVSERMEVAVATLKAGIWDFDIKKQEIFLTDTLFELLGFPPIEKNQPAGEFFDLIFYEDRNIFLKQLEDNMGNQGIQTAKVRMHLENKEVAPVELNWKVVFGENQMAERVVGTLKRLPT